MDKTPELSSKARLRFWFPEWPLALRAAGLSERRQESYAIAIRWYLSYCKRAHVPVDPDSARQFLETQCREHPAAGAFGDSWREAIAWFMEEGSRLVQLRRDLEAYGATSRDRQYHPSLAGSESPVRQVAAAGQGSPAGQWEEALGRVLRLKRYSPRTERVYLDWGRRLERRFGPLDQQGNAQVREFLEELAVKDRVGASTQRQALNALVFVFREALGKPLGDLGDYRRARVRQRLPVCLTWAQLQRLFAAMKGPQRLMAQLMFGTGLRLREMLQLRVMDLDFGHGLVMVRRGKGNQDRATPMPRRLRGELEEHLQRVREQFEADQQAGVGPVWLPEDLARRYPEAGHRWEWQWVWPSRELTREGEGGALRRHHLRERVLQEAIREAAKRAEIAQHVTPHALRHSYATELLRRGANIRQVQELLGHSEVSTTLVYSHVLARPGVQIVSPVDD